MRLSGKNDSSCGALQIIESGNKPNSAKKVPCPSILRSLGIGLLIAEALYQVLSLFAPGQT